MPQKHQKLIHSECPGVNCSFFVVMTDSVNAWKDRISKQKDDQDSLIRKIRTLNDGLKAIRRGRWTTSETGGSIIQISSTRVFMSLIQDHTAALVESAQTAASAANSTIAIATERLSNISVSVSLTSGKTERLLAEAEDICES